MLSLVIITLKKTSKNAGFGLLNDSKCLFLVEILCFYYFTTVVPREFFSLIKEIDFTIVNLEIGKICLPPWGWGCT